MTAPKSSQKTPPASPLLVLLVSVVGFSFAAPLIRLSSASPLVIATWRMGFSVVLVGIALLLSGTWRTWATLARSDFLLAGAGGVMLALHFWSWNTSLVYTSVAASVSLVNLQPALVALVSVVWLGERPNGRQWSGIAIAILGALVVGVADVPGGISGIMRSLSGGGGGGSADRALLGDFLAVVGAVAGTGYYLVGRRVRQRLDLWPYVGLVYSAAFIILLLLAVGTGEKLLPQAPKDLAIFAGLALGPTLLGHTGLNWALAYLPAFIVNLTVLGEPIGATLLAAVIPGIGEIPGFGVVIGGALVLLGVILTAKRKNDKPT
ncbi:MAG: DMT family transporter [Gemmatimonadaceae bacterium]